MSVAVGPGATALTVTSRLRSSCARIARLGHGNLQVDAEDPSPQPMIAILDARPGKAEQTAAAGWCASAPTRSHKRARPRCGVGLGNTQGHGKVVK